MGRKIEVARIRPVESVCGMIKVRLTSYTEKLTVSAREEGGYWMSSLCHDASKPLGLRGLHEIGARLTECGARADGPACC